MSGDEEEERYSGCETVSFRELDGVLGGMPGLRRPYVLSIIVEIVEFVNFGGDFR